MGDGSLPVFVGDGTDLFRCGASSEIAGIMGIKMLFDFLGEFRVFFSHLVHS